MYKDFLGNEIETQCMACDFANARILPPFGLIEENKEIIVHIDPIVMLPGFLIISTKRHIFSYKDLTEIELISVSRSLKKYTNILNELDDISSVVIVQEEHSKEGHFHIWLFPWKEEYIKSGKTLSDIRELMSCYSIDNKYLNKCKEYHNLIFKRSQGDY